LAQVCHKDSRFKSEIGLHRRGGADSNVEGQIEMKKVHRIAGLKISRVAPSPEELFMEEPH
jgi:hypothetical protein